MREEDVRVIIFDNEMKASLELLKPEEDEEYTYTEVENIIKAKKVIYGVDHAKVSQMVKDQIYDLSCEIASGKDKIDGIDGYHEYKFNTNLSARPEINQDGSVNYWQLHVIELVDEGQEIVEMHDPIECKNGMTVTGKTLLAKKGKPVPPLQGRGFKVLPDNHHYVAAISGKIEKLNEKVFISEVYEINGDVDMKTGNIDFRGDVVIHGNVTSGMHVIATGSITIDGTVEAAVIKAGKDIIIRGGFIGGYKGLIETEKKLIVKFMEYGTARIGGSIQTDSILSCHVTCYDHIYMEGKRASVIGGYVYAACGIEVYSVGSDNGVETKITVGIERMHLQQILSLRSDILDQTELLKKIEKTLNTLETLARQKGENPANDPKRAALLRTKIKTQSDVKINQMELERLEDLKERAVDASVKIIRDVYPGVTVTIGTEFVQVKEKFDTIEFKLDNGKIMMYSMRAL